jgi:signal transduction histidine kinase
MGIMKSENDNIGIGLACSKEICKEMGGDIALKVSRKGLTAFSFKIPIKVQRPREEEDMISVVVDSQLHLKKEAEIEVVRLIGSERPIPDVIIDFLQLNRINPNNNFYSEEIDSKDKSNVSKQIVAH